MRRFTMSSILVVLLLGLPLAALGQWNIQTVDNSGDVGTQSDVAYDGDGNPHIVYAAGAELHYTYWTGDAWSAIENLGLPNSPGTVYDCAIDIDVAGNVLIAVCHDKSGWAITYVRFYQYSGGEWTSQEIEYVENWDATPYCDLATEHTTTFGVYRPHIVYQKNSELWHASYDPQAEQWDLERVDQALSVGAYCSLAVDSQENLHVCYYDAGAQNLKYARYDTGWHQQYAIESQDDVGSHCSITVDASDNPHIVYYDATHSRLMHAEIGAK